MARLKPSRSCSSWARRSTDCWRSQNGRCNAIYIKFICVREGVVKIERTIRNYTTSMPSVRSCIPWKPCTRSCHGDIPYYGKVPVMSRKRKPGGPRSLLFSLSLSFCISHTPVSPPRAAQTAIIPKDASSPRHCAVALYFCAIWHISRDRPEHRSLLLFQKPTPSDRIKICITCLVDTAPIYGQPGQLQKSCPLMKSQNFAQKWKNTPRRR